MAFLVVVVFVLLQLLSPSNWPEIANAQWLSLYIARLAKAFKLPLERQGGKKKKNLVFLVVINPLGSH